MPIGGIEIKNIKIVNIEHFQILRSKFYIYSGIYIKTSNFVSLKHGIIAKNTCI